MAFRFYNTNDAGAPQDGAPLPNGLARVDTFAAYKSLRERELALHRLMCEVFTMQNGGLDASSSPSPAPENGGTGAPAPTALTRAQRRLLEDVRDACGISEECTAIELSAAATNPTVVKVAGSGVAKSRALFFDGLDDVPLTAPVYHRTAGIGGVADDGGRLACALASSTSAARPVSPQPQLNAASPAAAAAAADPSRMYMSDLAVIEKEIRALIKEVLAEGTSEARRTLVHAALQEKRQVLVGLKATLTA